MNIFLACLTVMAASCSSSGNDSPAESTPTPGESNGVAEVVELSSNLIVDLSTDKACYKPGETVKFNASDVPAGASVRYRHGSKVIASEPMSSESWTWIAPSDDYRGYLIEIVTPGKNEKEEVILGTIAVDVSSDWTRFPRYGFVATFDTSKLGDGVIEDEMAFLNRCHINGVQFQDWHYKHHWPLPGMRDNVLENYKDIANRDLSAAAVRKYIDVQHTLGMKSIFYNLCFGALDDAAADGVKEEWYAFKNDRRGDKDMHTLPSDWKSSIYVLDPGNEEWQSYLAERNDEVYANFDFDGYQIDQLGNRGDLYDYNGNKINLPKGYASFIDAMKTHHPSKRLIMNAVSSFGASQIASTGKMDFCYNEVWNDEPDFSDLHAIIKANDAYSGNTLRTVFAAYMNYDKAGRTSGEFNTPGILMADAVMMALGGSHLELGDHMLSREYFPASPLTMDTELREAIIRYYDFMTAYENLLRDVSTQGEFDVDLKCSDASKRIDINAWPPKQGGLTTYSKNVGNAKVIHLLNFRNIDNLSWRDLNGERQAPRLTLNTPLTLTHQGKATRVWTASPDYHGGAVQELPFTQEGDKLTFTLPALKYWSMIVVE
ncbi:MAG: cycloisomaltooligosaccharide glucanotransferase [Bacteroides sp.]|nr:cycloisomaltooligosaccharide glucanotransferase [Bacteroides sp.]